MIEFKSLNSFASMEDVNARTWIIGIFLAVLMIAAFMISAAAGNHRKEIDALTRRIEALEKRK